MKGCTKKGCATKRASHRMDRSADASSASFLLGFRDLAIVRRLPRDQEWESIEARLSKAASSALPAPEE
jgi:hypothetical protein